jgi:hypothetical protein
VCPVWRLCMPFSTSERHTLPQSAHTRRGTLCTLSSNWVCLAAGAGGKRGGGGGEGGARRRRRGGALRLSPKGLTLGRGRTAPGLGAQMAGAAGRPCAPCGLCNRRAFTPPPNFARPAGGPGASPRDLVVLLRLLDPQQQRVALLRRAGARRVRVFAGAARTPQCRRTGRRPRPREGGTLAAADPAVAHARRGSLGIPAPRHGARSAARRPPPAAAPCTRGCSPWRPARSLSLSFSTFLRAPGLLARSTQALCARGVSARSVCEPLRCCLHVHCLERMNGYPLV